MRGHERPDTVQPFAVEPYGQPAVALLLDQLVCAAVPDLDGSRSVLARRDRPLEITVFERVILDVDGEMTLAMAERDPLRDGPARQGAGALEPEVVVESPRGMPLDDEPQRCARLRALPERLRRPGWVALASIGVEAHLWIVATSATRSSRISRRSDTFPAKHHFSFGG